MTTNTKDADARLEDVLEDFSMSSPTPSAEMLERFVRKYPQYARELATFAVNLALEPGEDSNDGASASDNSSPEVEKAISRLHNRLHAVSKARESVVLSSPANPFSALSGASLLEFERAVGVNRVLVAKMRDRLIEPDTIPGAFTKVVAEHLQVPVELMSAHWQGPSQIPPNARFKADQKPETSKRESFEEPVKRAKLTAEQERRLLSM